MKEKILAKSEEMFLNFGVRSVTMDDIAAALGISKKTIYTHFATKSKLVEATAFCIFKKISEGISKIRAEESHPIEELFKIKNFALRHLKNEKSSPQFQLQKYYPGIYANLKKKQQALLEEQIKQNLQKGITSGLYREGINTDFISRIYFVGLMGIKDRTIFPENRYSMSELIQGHLEYHLRAITTPKGLASLEDYLNTDTQP